MIRMILRGIAQFLKGCVMLPFDFMRWLTGQSGGNPLPPPAVFEDLSDDEAGRLREELEAPVRRREAGTAARTLGGLVHAYASGDRQARDAFDFGRLPEHVGVALLTLRPDELLRLKGATPEACGRWALGERSGIIGIPPCAKDWLAAPVSGKPRDGEQAPSLVPAGEPPCGRQLRLAA